MNAIFTRRSVRKFLDKEVEKEKIELLLKAAMQSPSAKNQQPWEFIVIKGKDNLLKLSAFAPFGRPIAGANVAIMILGNMDTLKSPNYYQQDLGACAQSLMIEACHIGLGSVWIGAGPDEARMAYLREMFSLEENLFPFSVIAIGYPEKVDANYFEDRFNEDIITYID